MSLRSLLLPLFTIGMLAGLSACAGNSPATPPAASQSSFPFAVGKTWNYQLTVKNAEGESFTGDATLELTRLDGSNAGFKLVGHMPSGFQDSREMQGDLNTNPYLAGERVGGTTIETISVPAGSFPATKETVRSDEMTNEVWYDNAHGLLKLISTYSEDGKTTVSTYELK